MNNRPINLAPTVNQEPKKPVLHKARVQMMFHSCCDLCGWSSPGGTSSRKDAWEQIRYHREHDCKGEGTQKRFTANKLPPQYIISVNAYTEEAARVAINTVLTERCLWDIWRQWAQDGMPLKTTSISNSEIYQDLHDIIIETVKDGPLKGDFVLIFKRTGECFQHQSWPYLSTIYQNKVRTLGGSLITEEEKKQLYYHFKRLIQEIPSAE